jgi:hypothetical protein
MNKNIQKAVILVCMLSSAVQLEAEAPELNKMLPTEWKYMTKLPENEKITFDAAHGDVYTQIYKAMEADYAMLHDKLFVDKENEKTFQTKASVYKEIVCTDTFYWIILPVTKVKNPIGNSALLCLFREENGVFKLLTQDATNIKLAMQAGYTYRINTVQIIKGKEQAKGFIQYLNVTGIDENYKYTDTEKGQLCGSVDGFYFLFKDEPERIELYAQNIFNMIPQNWDRINITASDFLWDKDEPLKYGLQNAFDGDSTTSYVENTKDDLIFIKFDLLIPKLRNITEIAMINGYASSSDLYKKNNRLKNGEIESYKIVTENGNKKLVLNAPVEFLCKDDNLRPQHFDFNIKRDGALKIQFIGIYAGEKYNDTCIAELNIKASNNMWLFGDIHE